MTRMKSRQHQNWKNKAGLALVGFLLLCLTVDAFSQVHMILPDDASRQHTMPGHVIFKISPAFADDLKQEEVLRNLVDTLTTPKTLTAFNRVFPNHQPPDQRQNKSGYPLTDLTRIYELILDDPALVTETILKLAATGLVEYVQPRFLPESLVLFDLESDTLYYPNDSLLFYQYYLQNIRAFEAWAIARGDTNVVIGIVDTGTDLLHPDLVDAIAYNYDDPVNGEDTDGDGYVDNFFGWDLGENNNDPGFNRSAHGLHVGGIAAATADNREGIAGTGFYSRFLPVKVDDEFGRLVKAYEGIIYAADQGAAVINCSWGSHVHPGPFGQDVINYAVFNRDALVVAASGNAADNRPFFPASLEHTLSVAATDSLDRKAGFSSYGNFVDVVAPGLGILSTWVNGSYMRSGGTSMAAPIVSGAAAILRSYYPELNAMQIAARLKITADLVDTLGGNLPYAGELGFGRLNVYRALSDSPTPYVQIDSLWIDENEMAATRPGSMLSLSMGFENILASARGITAILSSNSPWMEAVKDTLYVGDMDSGIVYDNGASPFAFRTRSGMPVNHQVLFTLSFFNEAGKLAGRQSFPIVLNTNYVNLQAGYITTTVSSSGAIGYNYPDYNQGRGFLYKNSYTLLTAGGLIIASDAHHVTDQVYGEQEGSFSQVLEIVNLPEKRNGAGPDHYFIEGTTTDPAPLHALQIEYRHHYWTGAEQEDFMIMDYEVINTTEMHRKDLYAGFFADWFLRDRKHHRASYIPALGMGYAFDENGGYYTGIQLLSSGGIRHYAFDNTGFGGSIQISDGFSMFQKHTALNSNRLEAGRYHTDNDIATLVSTGPFSLAGGDTLHIAFALHVADSYDQLLENGWRAVMRYNQLSDLPTQAGRQQKQAWDDHVRVWPNPFSRGLNIEFSTAMTGHYTITLTDATGRAYHRTQVKLNTGHSAPLWIDTSGMPPGLYVLQAIGNGRVYSRKMIRHPSP